jgi:anaerobic dimethyl sulfoxide reductase subunit B (iron-sulfur subunit)
MSEQLGFYFNSDICVSCRTCVIACKDKNDNPLGVNFRRVISYEGGSWIPHPTIKGVMQPSNIFVYSVSVACMHCQKPICVEVCPTGAMNKNGNGIVAVNQDKCIGCRLCQQSCPYGAPQFNEAKGVMSKCDLCQDLIATGEKPACVASCPQRALDYGELSELKAKYGEGSSIEPLPDPSLTWPAVVITPHRQAQPSGQGTGRIVVEV